MMPAERSPFPTFAPDSLLALQENLRHIANFSRQVEDAALAASVRANEPQNAEANLTAALQLCELNLGLTEHTVSLVRNTAHLLFGRAADVDVENRSLSFGKTDLRGLLSEAETLRQDALVSTWRLASTLRKIVCQLSRDADSTHLKKTRDAEREAKHSYADIRNVLSGIDRRIDGYRG